MRIWNVVRSRVNGTTALAVTALVFAMTGGAYAAKRYLITSKAQIKPSVLKQLQGSRGQQGPAGPQGAQGAAGKDGANGANGKEGAPGTPGTSASTASFAGEQHGCHEGGLEVKSAGTPSFVCNGTKGTNGQTGFTETLPAGETETGSWAINEYGPLSEEKDIFIPISFSIPTVAGEGFYLNQAETETAGTVKPHGCEGSVTHPTAPAGKLCVYTEEPEETTGSTIIEIFSAEGLGHFVSSGGFIEFAIKSGAQAVARGSWAVTAP